MRRLRKTWKSRTGCIKTKLPNFKLQSTFYATKRTHPKAQKKVKKRANPAKLKIQKEKDRLLENELQT